MKNEIFVLCAALVGGALIGVLFDFFRAYRLKVKSNKKATAFQDIMFWTVSSYLIFALIYRINGAQIRWYIFAGLAVGALIYNATVSKLMVKLILFVAKTVITVTGFIIKPFVKFAKYLKKPFFIVFMPYRRLKYKIRSEINKIKKFLKLY